MRFNTNREGGYRDYEEFSKFLGLNGSRCQRQSMDSIQNQGCARQENESQMSIGRGKSLAMVYPQKQDFIMLYDPEVALQIGTAFEELNKPFDGSSCRGTNNGEGC